MHHLEPMLRSHPAPAGSNGEQARECIVACADCAAACTICADACLHEPEIGPLAQCIRLAQDCADICRTTGLLVSRPGHADAPTLQLQLRACIQACQACADECERHARAMEMEHCRICAEACRRCAAACEAMAGALVP